MIKTNDKPQLKKTPDITTIIPTRALWNPKFRAVADKVLQNTNGTVIGEEINIPRRDGGSSRALLCRPQATSNDTAVGGRPLVVIIHGGGFVYGAPEMEVPTAVAVVQEHDCVAVCLSY